MNAREPSFDLSVVVVSFNTPALLECCLASLHRQTYREGVEVLVVRHNNSDKDLIRDQSGNLQIRWIPAPQRFNLPQMRSLGLVSCRANVVAFIEDDCIAEENWLETLLEAHRQPHIAIGGAVDPGDYRSGQDWAYYFSEYCRFMSPLPFGKSRTLPGTNVSYKVDELFRLIGGRERVHTEGFYETFIHQGLLKAGATLISEPGLVVYNSNSWGFSRVIEERYHHGRGYAAMRVAGFPFLKRIPYAFLAGLLPAILIFRVVRQVVSRRRWIGKLIQALPWIVMISLSWSLGEFLGYIFGPGDSLERWR